MKSVCTSLLILLPQQLQGDVPVAAKLGVDGGKVRRWNLRPYPLEAIAKQPLLQGSIIQIRWQGPSQTGGTGPAQVIGYRTVRAATTPSNLPVLQSQLKLEAKDFFDFAHGQPLGWHSVPPRNNREENLPADCPTHASLRKDSDMVSTHSGILSTSSAQVKKWTTSRRNP